MPKNNIFDNKNRNRYYGLRIGDIVEERAFGNIIKGEVVEFGDNNACLVKREKDGKEVKCVCEWCHIITKVENRNMEEKYDQEAIEAIKKIPKLQQVQYSLKKQLNVLIPAANRLGLYDASDFLLKVIQNKGE